MSQQSALEFVTRASADAQLFIDVIEATGGLDPTYVDDAQFVAATAVGRRAGYAFSPAELRQAFDAFAQAHPEQVYDRELSLAELDLVAGGSASVCFNGNPGQNGVQASRIDIMAEDRLSHGPLPLPRGR